MLAHLVGTAASMLAIAQQPVFTTNITVFHVYPGNFGPAPVNMVGVLSVYVHVHVCVLMSSYTVCVALHDSTGLFIPVRMIYVMRAARLVIGNMLMVTGRMCGKSSDSGVAVGLRYVAAYSVISSMVSHAHIHYPHIHTRFRTRRTCMVICSLICVAWRPRLSVPTQRTNRHTTAITPRYVHAMTPKHWLA